MRYLVLLLALLAQIAHADSPAWQDRWWLEKASRALRGGDSLRPGENADQLLALGREQVVQKFVADPRFGDTVLGFNLAFLGFRQDRPRKENGNFEDIAYELPHAISSARAVLGGGDYFSLFDLQHPLYLGPLLRPYTQQDGDDNLDAPTLRQKTYQRVQDDLDRLIAMAPSGTPVEICTAFNEHMETYVFDNPYNLPRSITRNVMRVPSWYGKLENDCNSDPLPTQDYVAPLQAIKARNAQLFAKLAAFEPAAYKTTDVGAIKVLDLSDMTPPLEYKHTQFTFLIQRTLLNSSTNYDRKRAAYVLKRFFCDDLTPVAVETPAVHVGEKHASDPSCFACHYKLDPMAGFFRDYGRVFRDYSQRKNIFFDDGAFIDRVTYEKNWQPGPDADHPWNVGYIRSTRKASLNTYGSSLDDLYAMLKTAPEVRRCLMKRMFEYFVSDKQTMDGGFLDYLTEQFNLDLKTSSSAAIKNAAARIVLSRSFSTPGADADSCYDFRPGQASSGVPCKVASILNQQCVKCHGSTDGEASLDLSSWKKFADGTQGFPHLADDGSDIPARTTFEQMIARITSTDPEFRMPLHSDMPSTDAQQLYLWINDQLKQLGPGVTQ